MATRETRSDVQTKLVLSRRRLKGHPLQVRHEQDWGRGFILLLPQAALLPDQMLAVMLLSQHRVSSSKTVRTRAPYGARSMEHAIRTWFSICSAAPHSQFGEGRRLHLCMDEWNRPTPVLRLLSLTQAVRSKLTGPGYENTEPGCILTILRVPSIVCPLRSADGKFGKVV